MAQRMVFYVDENSQPQQKKIEFQWFPGFAKKQVQKSICALHERFLQNYSNAEILETSSASSKELGLQLSAFNLQVKTTRGKFSVEQLFQAGKIFKDHGSQKSLLRMPPAKIKKKIKLLNNIDELIGFQEFGVHFPLIPSTYFYNWIYLKGIQQNKELAQALLKYNAFTDIYFNSKKSINCQAEACSIYISLFKRKLLEDALDNKENFLQIVYDRKKVKKSKHEPNASTVEQLSLFKT